MLNRRIKYYTFLIITGISILFSCRQNPKHPVSRADSIKKKIVKEWNKTIPGSFSDQTKAVFDSLQINIFLKKYPAFDPYAKDINLFYSKRKFAYAWYASNTLIEQAGNLVDRLNNLQNEGIYRAIPYPKSLDSLVFDAHPKATTAKAKTNITTELMLTAQYFVFSKLAFQGMSDSVTRAVNWYLPRKKVSYNDYLDSLLKKPGKPGGVLSEPVYRQYDLLKSFLAKYRHLDTIDKWQPILPGKKLKPGDSSAVISLIKKRLYKLEDFKGDTLSNIYDDELKDAFKQFQLRHGLTADGIEIGRASCRERVSPYV